jgi:hypothetical protein
MSADKIEAAFLMGRSAGIAEASSLHQPQFRSEWERRWDRLVDNATHDKWSAEESEVLLGMIDMSRKGQP